MASCRNQDNKRNRRYIGDSEEGVGLLGTQYDAEEEYDEHKPQQEPPKSSAFHTKDNSRTIHFNPSNKVQSRYPPNIVRNQKYNAFAFLPIVFYEQFKFFFNIYILLVALSQFVPALKTAFIITYVAPLACVLSVTMGKEAYDNYKRHLQDREANSQRYLVLEHPTSHSTAEDTYLNTHANTRSNQRVPADLVLLRTPDSSGTCFIRTEQLDGETDWKFVLPGCQKMDEGDLVQLDAEIYADASIKDIHAFVGTFTLNKTVPSDLSDSAVPLNHMPPSVSPLTVENVLWSNTVLAAGSAIGFVIYTGAETHAVMNTSHPETKVGLLDLEINKLAKILCAVTFALSLVLVALNGFRGEWSHVYILRFLILFSSIIPISLRVNLDMGKTV